LQKSHCVFQKNPENFVFLGYATARNPLSFLPPSLECYQRTAHCPLTEALNLIHISINDREDLSRNIYLQ